MQKKLIALAVAGLVSGGAFAQSNVTIYGVADATFDSVRATGSALGAAAEFKSRSRVTSNSSYIGFKGTEDLGDGLKAVFQFENGLTTENGAAGAWNNRDSFVGLDSGFGKVRFGNLTGPTRALGAKLDVNAGATGIGTNTSLLAKFGGGSGAGNFDQRINNTIAYISPSFSGFNAAIAYSTGYTNAQDGTAFKGRESAGKGTSAQGNTAYSLGLSYDNGPLYVGYAYTGVNASNDGAAAADGLLAGTKKVDDNRLGAIYKIGAGQVGFLWDRMGVKPSAGGKKLTQNVYYLSGTYNVTPAGKVIAQFGRANDITDVKDTGAKHFVLGYEYSLSKRTILKALYSRVDNKAASSYDFLYGVSNANSTATTTTGVGAGNDASGVSFGIRHSF